MVWNLVFLDELTTYMRRGKTPKYANNGEVRIINQRCVRWGHIDLNPARFLESSVVNKWSQERFLQQGDVLINSTGDGTIGRAAIWTGTEEKFVVDSHVTIIRTVSSQLDPRWLCYWFQSDLGQKFVVSSKTGATKQTELGVKKIKQAEIPLPTLLEQQAIIRKLQLCLRKLGEIDQLSISNANELNELKTSLIFGNTTTRSDFEELNSVVDWIQDTEAVQEDEIYYFAGAKSFGKGLFHSATRTSQDFKYKGLRRLKYRDFTYPKLMAWEGAFGMVPKEFDGFVVSPEFVVFRTKDGIICPEVLDTYFRSPICLEDVRNASTGSNKRRRRLNPKAFLKLKVPVPPHDAQEKLKKVYEFEAKASESWKELPDTLEKIRQGILRKAFAGEL